MEFTAEIKTTSSKKLASNDMEYRLVLSTDNPLILDLGKLPAETYFKVRIDID